MELDVVIIGGGAAGLATAIFAARLAPGLSIAVLDGARRLGAKILVSGGGRCNVTNAVVQAGDYCGGSSHTIRRVLSALPVPRTIAFFQELGVALHEEPQGKLFPDTHSARTVLDALLREAQRLGVEILTDHRVLTVIRDDGGFTVNTNQGTRTARRVVLATGGQSLPKTGSDGSGYRMARALGHTLVPTSPALAPLILEGGMHTRLSGVSQDVELTVRVENQKPLRLCGSLLWTHFGISGPVVLDASRHWHRAVLDHQSVRVTANFLPGQTFEQVEVRFSDWVASSPKTALHNAISTIIPARAADALLTSLQIDRHIPLVHLVREFRRRIVHALLESPLEIKDSRGYNHAEVTAGGVALAEIDPASMQSRRCPGLYLVGEILDVDGRIGGFNFQWAWASGFVAARGVAESEK